MPEFCKTCPMRGNCESKIVGDLTGPLEARTRRLTQFFKKVIIFDGFVAVLFDDNNNVSMPFNRNVSIDHVIRRVDACIQPGLDSELQHSAPVLYCPAIGAVAIDNPKLSQNVQARFQAIADAEAFRQPRA